MKLSLIVAVSENGVIGKDGKIPWFVRGEQKRFKELTMGKPMIMGRRTHEAIGKTLPGRPNIVISSNTSYEPNEGTIVVHSFDEALKLPVVQKSEEVVVIGGARVFEEAMPLAQTLYLTKVHVQVEGDTFFKYNPAEWRKVKSEFFEKDAVPDRPFDFEVGIYTKEKLAN